MIYGMIYQYLSTHYESIKMYYVYWLCIFIGIYNAYLKISYTRRFGNGYPERDNLVDFLLNNSK
jgi:hypothetical protein